MTRLLIALFVAGLLAGCPSEPEEERPPIVAFEPAVVELGQWTVTTDGLPEPVTVRLANRGFGRVSVTTVGIADDRIVTTPSAELPAEVEPGAWLTITVAYAASPTGPVDIKTTLDATVRAVGDASGPKSGF